jgi:hypothetical protein
MFEYVVHPDFPEDAVLEGKSFLGVRNDVSISTGAGIDSYEAVPFPSTATHVKFPFMFRRDWQEA